MRDPKAASAQTSPPCVVVLHEVWGADSHIKDVCKRLRKLGFATVVPSLYRGYKPLFTPNNIRKAMAAVWDLSLEERRDKKKVAAELEAKGADIKASEVLEVLYDQDFRDRMLGIALSAIRTARKKHGWVATLGFSLGGGLSLAAATKPDGPDAAVSYCGEPPRRQSLAGADIPMLVICASHGELMSPLMPGFVEAALEEESDLTVKTFPGTQHDFFNETKKGRYNRAAAEEAWDFTVWFLAKALRRGPSFSKR
ncbi:MAG: dienelactone hydrolase family protein [Nitrososphaerota archaeon]|nr:dienelactone hydrolase family protein [Nitrososphaerota archaeon]